jgi:cation diffusion facilitator CzcD-associated flavoprotein CzcO
VATASKTREHLDVLVIGAGISGIAAGYYLQTRCPDKSYAILEAREVLGGTWDLFRYPGIRSDSDMHTLGFSFRPWPHDNAIADGGSILRYLQDTARELQIDRKIRFSTRATHFSWSSRVARWTVTIVDCKTGEESSLTCSFLWTCTGYYRYDRGYTPDFPGFERYQGQVVHPQKWTNDIDYAGKRVVVIGSGATAVTLVPAMAGDADHVTMLQRSPSYIFSVPPEDPIAAWLKRKLPLERALPLVRWKNVLFGIGLYQYCQKFPRRARKFLMNQVRKQVGDSVDVDTHFNPSYDPWDQRLCLVPDGDLFAAINAGKVDVVTDHIETFTEEGIRLRSGRELEADMIITATGLQLQFLGGATADVDGEPVDFGKTMLYKGMMVSDLPNAALCIGYSNASWTLKVELTCEFVTDLLRLMDERGYRMCCPRRDPRVGEEPPMDLKSGYIERALGELPSQGSERPWRLYQNYVLDKISMRPSKIEDGTLAFER